MDLKIKFIADMHCMSLEKILIHYISVESVFIVHIGPCGFHFKVEMFWFIAISYPVVSLLSWFIRLLWISHLEAVFNIQTNRFNAFFEILIADTLTVWNLYKKVIQSNEEYVGVLVFHF